MSMVKHDEDPDIIFEKNAIERFKKFSGILLELLISEKALVAGDSLEQEAQQLQRLISHVERLWDDSSRLMLADSYPSAVFLALVCIEETGKIGAAYFQIMNNESVRKSGKTPKSTKSSSRKTPFYSHKKKHWLAAGAGALVNSRLDRKLGIEGVKKFLDDVENGKIEELRQSCLYADHDHDGREPIIPCERITKDTAIFYVVMAGELLANILGFGMEEFRLKKKVDDFQSRFDCHAKHSHIQTH